MILDLVFFALSMAVLIYCADLLIESSEKIAYEHKISPFIIGATLIAFGTSLPEITISLIASMEGKTDMAISNVMGSYIFNIGLILGFVLLITKNATLKRDFFSKDSLWVILPLFMFVLVAYDGMINYIDSVFFITLMVAYLMFLFASDKKSLELESENDEIINHTINKDKKENMFLVYLFVVLGLGGVVIGANFSVVYATNIAIALGVSQWVIGVVLLAFGSSLPELVVGIKSALKNNIGLAFGAIVGSNVANFAMVLGLSSFVTNLDVNLNNVLFDLATAFILAFMLIFIMATKAYNRSSGIVLLIITFLFIKHTLGV